MGKGCRSARIRARAASHLPVLLGVLVGMLWGGSVPALALSQRGHIFSFSFGEEGVHQGQFRRPSAVAVNDSTGEVYVADRLGNQVDEFATVNKQGEPILNSEHQPSAEFVRAFSVPAPEAIAVDNCTVDSISCSKEQDPSVGDVYVASTTPSHAKEPEPEEGLRVDKFSAEGAPITKLATFKLPKQRAEDFEEHIDGVAVDSANGALLIYVKDGKIYRFNDAGINQAEAVVQSSAGEGRPGFALDAEGDFYVGIEEVQEFADSLDEELTGQIEAEGLADGLFETGQFELAAKLAAGTGAVTAPELDDEYTKALAVNPVDEPGNSVSEQNDVYLDNVSSVAGEPHTTVAAFNAKDELLQRFSAPELREGDGIAVDSKTGAVFVTDAASDKVDVFALESRARPAVDELSACTLGLPGCPQATGTVELQAQVNPAGAATTVEFQYGPANCSAAPSLCRTSLEMHLGDGFGDRSASFSVDNLIPGTYHYRVVATNEFGTVSSAQQTFSVLAATSALPDARGWELVSPPQKHGAEPELTKEGGDIQAAADGHAITYVTDGPVGPDAAGSRNPEYTQLLSTVDADGEWTTQDLATPNTAGRGIQVGEPQEYQLFSTNLALALVEPFPGGPGSSPFAEPPLSPLLPGEEQGRQEKTIYLRDDQPLQPEAADAEQLTVYGKAKENGDSMKNAGFLALVKKSNAPDGKPFGGERAPVGGAGGVRALAASPDLGHVLFTASEAAPGLFEWGPEEQVRLVSVLPDGTPSTGLPGDQAGIDVRNAISSDGALVFWTSTTNHLYVRDTVTAETVQLDLPQQGAPPASGPPDAVFQTASADGSKLFFTDTQRLTATSKALASASDLYVAELHGGEVSGSQLAYTLTDLTPEGLDGESAGIPSGSQGGGVIGVSEDGSYVYFVADAALAAGAHRGDCAFEEEPPPPGTSCNLYVRHREGTRWGPTRLVAALSPRDLPDWGGEQEGDLTFMTSRVAPNGEYMAFMSDRSLTGYDNEDVSSEQPGERLDEEVFVYHTSTERLVCVSCDPSGERPHGVFDSGATEPDTEGEGLLVDRPHVWSPREEGESERGTDHWLAGSVPGWTPMDVTSALYQSRYLLDDGRLFFDSPDQLVPAATGTKEKVYEYEPDGIGSCDSEGGCIGLLSAGDAAHEAAFLDASTSGNDVFFITAEKLVPQDSDDFFDVYDAHICDASAPCLTASAVSSSSCDATPAHPCKAGEFSTPAFTLPASAGFSGIGNASGRVLSAISTGEPKRLTRAQKLAEALKTCEKDANRHQRRACEKRAREQFGATRAKSAGLSDRSRRPRR